MRVLFVDSEPRVLEAMSRVWFELEPHWELAFARTTDEAFAALSQAPCDVLVSDLHGPSLDGTMLLTRAAELFPRLVRIVLSAHVTRSPAVQLAHVAHQFFAKPCAAETLHDVLSRLQQLTVLLPDRKLQALATQLGSLPCAPDIHRRLLDLAETADDVPALVALIEQDPSLTGKLMQVAGSGFFGSAASVTDVQSAVMRLGAAALGQFARSLGEPPPQRPSSLPSAGALQACQQRSLAIARVAASLARLPEDASAAYLAGLLCDVGNLVFLRSAPERLYVVQAEAAQQGVPPHVAEMATFSATHGEVGAFLLGVWGLPFQVVEAVANHHAPERGESDRLGLSQLVAIAACVVEGHAPSLGLMSRVGAEEAYARALSTFSDLSQSK